MRGPLYYKGIVNKAAGARDVWVSDGMMWTADAIVKCHCCDGGRSTTTRPAGQIAARTHWPSRGESDIFVFRPRSTPFSCSDNLSLACSRYIYQRRGAHSSVALRPTPLLLLNVPCPLLRAHIHPSPAVLTSPLCSLFLRLSTPVFIACYAFCVGHLVTLPLFLL